MEVVTAIPILHILDITHRRIKKTEYGALLHHTVGRDKTAFAYATVAEDIEPVARYGTSVDIEVHVIGTRGQCRKPRDQDNIESDNAAVEIGTHQTAVPGGIGYIRSPRIAALKRYGRNRLPAFT
jgi:ribosomal protein S11